MLIKKARSGPEIGCFIRLVRRYESRIALHRRFSRGEDNPPPCTSSPGALRQSRTRLYSVVSNYFVPVMNGMRMNSLPWSWVAQPWFHFEGARGASNISQSDARRMWLEDGRVSRKQLIQNLACLLDRISLFSRDHPLLHILTLGFAFLGCVQWCRCLARWQP